LSVITIIVNGVALSAILFRISEWGITPNRAAVLGGNVLILINLLLVTAQLFKVLFKKVSITSVGKAISYYLPVYVLWVIIVTFLFPLIFAFK
jgi:NADH:ubiquinone oxidoreductase subunit K